MALVDGRPQEIQVEVILDMTERFLTSKSAAKD